MTRILICIALVLTLTGTAFARGRHSHSHTPASSSAKPFSWDRTDVDLSAVDIQPYSVAGPDAPTLPGSAVAPPTHARVHNALLENGLMAHTTRAITPPDIRSRDLFVLYITQTLEGGFDSVNMYDRGILSWGIMQWTAQSGSLAGVLGHIKNGLLASHQAGVWNKTFVANGIDMTGGHLVVYGKPVLTPQDARVAFRGTVKLGEGDPNLMAHWVTVFARAGRQGRIEQLEIEYAGRVVDRLLDRRAPVPYHAPGRSGVTVAELTGNDPYAEALVFALWDNSPTNAIRYVADAARAARAVSISDDPSLWPAGAFTDALLRRCANSRIGNWPARAALIEARATLAHTASADRLSPFEADYQQVIARRKQVRLVALASRHRPQPRIRIAAMVERADHADLLDAGRLRPTMPVLTVPATQPAAFVLPSSALPDVSAVVSVPDVLGILPTCQPTAGDNLFLPGADILRAIRP